MIRCEECTRPVRVRSAGRFASPRHHAIKDHTLCHACWERQGDRLRHPSAKEKAMSTATAEFPDLERFDDTFKPAEPSSFRPGLEIVPDGDHDFTILDADLGRTQKSREMILRLELKVEDTLQIVERAYLFPDHDAVARLGADLVMLGIDADRWTAANGRKFSSELPLAVPKLRGKRFRGHKKTANKDGKSYHNLYINALLTAGSTPLPRSTPAGGNPFTAPAHADSLPANPAAKDECPF